MYWYCIRIQNAVRRKGNLEMGIPGDYLLDTQRRFLWHMPVNTKRVKKIAQQILMAIFLAILLLSFLAHRLFHSR